MKSRGDDRHLNRQLFVSSVMIKLCKLYFRSNQSERGGNRNETGRLPGGEGDEPKESMCLSQTNGDRLAFQTEGAAGTETCGRGTIWGVCVYVCVCVCPRTGENYLETDQNS